MSVEADLAFFLAGGLILIVLIVLPASGVAAKRLGVLPSGGGAN